MIDLSHKEARNLFGPWVDEELPAQDAARLRNHLEDCPECRAGWQRFERAVVVVRRVERERAPPSLAGTILRRVRRQKHNGLRYIHLTHLQHRVPVEAAIPVLLGILVAAMLVLLAPQ